MSRKSSSLQIQEVTVFDFGMLLGKLLLVIHMCDFCILCFCLMRLICLIHVGRLVDATMTPLAALNTLRLNLYNTSY